jgi:teichuronic acid biosynthesis glycosyltransferase TuaH
MDQQIKSYTPKEPAIVMLALARHDAPYSSTAWSLARVFAEEGTVLFIDNPFTLIDFLKKDKQEQIRKRFTRWLRRKQDLIKQAENLPNLYVGVAPLMLPVNWLPDGALYQMGSAFNRWLLRRRIDRCIREAGIQEFIFINSFNPFYGATPPTTFAPLKYIYQTVDAIGESKYIGKHGPRLESKAMQQADLCVATSLALTKRAAGFNPKAECVPNAADTALFRQAMDKKLPVPRELAGEQRQVICYIGHIDFRLDYDILKFTAQAHNDKLFLMVGPVSGNEWTDSGFGNLPNVVFTGKKPLEALPAYLQYAHVALIPFKCNTLTASIYPLKLNEYLAAGKPVVSTPFSEDVKVFREAVMLADKPEVFATALQEAIDVDSPEKRQQRIEIAEQNSWPARAAVFRSLFKTAGNPKQTKPGNLAYEESVK